MIRVYTEDTVGMNNQNVFKIMEVIDTDNFRDFIRDFNDSSLACDICHAINTSCGGVLVSKPIVSDKVVSIIINDKLFNIKPLESVSNVNKPDMKQSAEIQDYISQKCSIEWIL